MNLHTMGRITKATMVSLAMVLGLSSCSLDYVVGYVYMTTAKTSPGLIDQYSIDYQSGALWRYAQTVGDAEKGAVNHPGAKAETHVFADI